MTTLPDSYLLADHQSELERLRLQSVVWEPAACKLLDRLGDGDGLSVLDIGCGAMGWLRALSEWVGDGGRVVGTDIDGRMLDAAGELSPTLNNVELTQDDLFESALPPASFDLVHARFQLAPLGRCAEQVAAHRRLVKPGGILVFEEPDSTTWIYHPPSEAVDSLIDLVEAAFSLGGGDFNSGRTLSQLLEGEGLTAEMSREVVELEAGHRYLRLPIQFATSLRPRILEQVSEQDLDQLVAQAEDDIAHPECTAITFTLVQAVAAV